MEQLCPSQNKASEYKITEYGDGGIRFALASEEFVNGDTDANVSVMLAAMECCVGKNVDFVCFGQSFVQGMHAMTWNFAVDKSIAIKINGHVFARLKDAAKRTHTGAAFGYFEYDDTNIYCSLAVIDKNGELIANHRRIHSGWHGNAPDSAHYRDGAEFTRFTYRGKSIVTAICGDIWEESSAYAVRDIHPDIVLWSMCENFEPDDHKTPDKLWTSERMAVIGCDAVVTNSMEKGTIDAANIGAIVYEHGSTSALIHSARGLLITGLNA